MFALFKNRVTEATRLVLSIALISLAAPSLAQRSFETDILTDTFGFNDDTLKSVSLDELNQGCPARDCIPSIDDPVFVTANEARYIADDDIVLAVSWEDEYRAYPTRILDQHEIVNDVIAGTPIAITYCPLCGSGVGIIREVDGQVTEFGVSGLLYNSDLVFYDRATETLWDQIIAEGIVGPKTGNKLELVPVTMTRWDTWKAAHPETLALSAELGAGRDYSKDYYAKYRQDDKLMFPVSKTDDSIRPKSVVYGVDGGTFSFAATEAALHKSGELAYESGDRKVRMQMQDDGAVTAVDVESGESFVVTRLFWFAWYTFHPETELLH